MDLATIVIDPAEAAERAREYAEAFARDRNAEDAAMAQGFRAAARGLPIIQLSTVIAAGGRFPSGLPRIAIARADALEVECTARSGSTRGTVIEFTDVDPTAPRWRRSSSRARHVGEHGVNVRCVGDLWEQRTAWEHGRTMVPSVPPRHRPKRGRLTSCHVLWEVEAWTPAPPTDPALLRHIRGDLWAVLAVWDLTPLERAVLAQRAG